MDKEIKLIRCWIIFFMISLFVSGLTAIPVERELAFLSRCFSPDTAVGLWIDRIYTSIVDVNQQYPFLFYGYGLAFAHFVLAILFIGPYRDPVRNKWVIEFGMIACLLVIPFALIAGQFRSIPIGWRLIDCSFGMIGLIPLAVCLSRTYRIEAQQKEKESTGTEYLIIQ
jgi:hypothetical protein